MHPSAQMALERMNRPFLTLVLPVSSQHSISELNNNHEVTEFNIQRWPLEALIPRGN